MTRNEMMQKLQAQQSMRVHELADIANERRKLTEREQYATGFRHGVEYAIDYLKGLDETELPT